MSATATHDADVLALVRKHVELTDVYPVEVDRLTGWGPTSRHFEDIVDLAASISDVGLLEPLIVAHVDGAVRVIAGNRRLAAVKRLGWTQVPVRLASGRASRLLEVALATNVASRALDPLDEAAAYAKLRAAGHTQKAIARAVGRSQGHVSKYLALLHLDPELQTAIRLGELSINEAYHRYMKHANDPSKRLKPRKVGGRRLVPGSELDVEVVAEREATAEERAADLAEKRYATQAGAGERPVAGAPARSAQKRYVPLDADVYAAAQEQASAVGLSVTDYLTRLINGDRS